jgi:hypothetical protein
MPPAPEDSGDGNRINKIVRRSATPVEGLILHGNSAPQANARLVFVNTANQTDVRRLTANAAGLFRFGLAPGSWLVYVENNDGSRRFHSRVDVAQQNQPVRITLVSR